jgi:hypothetical protein
MHDNTIQNILMESPLINQQWYYESNGVQAGPISWDGLMAGIKMGQVTPETRVWSSHLAEWTPLSECIRGQTNYQSPSLSQQQAVLPTPITSALTRFDLRKLSWTQVAVISVVVIGVGAIGNRLKSNRFEDYVIQEISKLQGRSTILGVKTLYKNDYCAWVEVELRGHRFVLNKVTTNEKGEVSDFSIQFSGKRPYPPDDPMLVGMWEDDQKEAAERDKKKNAPVPVAQSVVPPPVSNPLPMTEEQNKNYAQEALAFLRQKWRKEAEEKKLNSEQIEKYISSSTEEIVGKRVTIKRDPQGNIKDVVIGL